MSHLGHELFVVGGAIIVGNRCLIGQRKHEGSFGGMWEFPGGKLESGEHAEQALVRELREELGVSIVMDAFLARGQAETPRHTVVLDVYSAFLVGRPRYIECREHLELKFVEAEEIPQYCWAAPDLPALVPLQRLLSGRTPEPLPSISRP